MGDAVFSILEQMGVRVHSDVANASLAELQDFYALTRVVLRTPRKTDREAASGVEVDITGNDDEDKVEVEKVNGPSEEEEDSGLGKAQAMRC